MGSYLVPQLGIRPALLAVKELSPNHWTAREFLTNNILFKGTDVNNKSNNKRKTSYVTVRFGNLRNMFMYAFVLKEK